MRSGVNAILVYAVLFDETGKPSQVDLVYPAKLDRCISAWTLHRAKP